jgi:hypothetical protein
LKVVAWVDEGVVIGEKTDKLKVSFKRLR